MLSIDNNYSQPISYLHQVTFALYPGHMTQYYILLPFRIGLVLMSLGGNILTLCMLWQGHWLRTSGTCRIIASLASADILVAVEQVSMAWQYFLTLTCDTLLLHDILCIVCLFPYAVSFCHIFLVCLDRFVAIQWALQYPTIMTDRRNLVLIGATWGLAVVYELTFLPYFLHTESYSRCESAVPREHDYWLKYGVFFLFTPLTVAMYCKIFHVAYQQRRKIVSVADTTTGQQGQERKATSMMAIIILMYFLFWLPYFGTCTAVYLGYTSRAVLATHQVARLLGTCNSAINVIIYAFMNKDFRHGYARILGCHIGENSPHSTMGTVVVEAARGQQDTTQVMSPINNGNADSTSLSCVTEVSDTPIQTAKV